MKEQKQDAAGRGGKTPQAAEKNEREAEAATETAQGEMQRKDLTDIALAAAKENAAGHENAVRSGSGRAEESSKKGAAQQKEGKPADGSENGTATSESTAPRKDANAVVGSGRLQDRIGDYLIPHTKDYLFDELSEDYLKRAGLADILTDVPVPIKSTDMQSLSNIKIAHNMSFIMGCDLNFRYRDAYIRYILRAFGSDFAKPLINEGIDAAAASDFDVACILFRGALLIDPASPDALYCYGRACRDAYEVGDGEEYIGRYKAEALEAFEKLTLAKPDFDMGYYYLAYAYLNLGLYLKASLTFADFLRTSASDAQAQAQKLREEAADWMEKLKEPIKIEQAYNKILSGRFQEGIDALLPYTEDDRFSAWWPLWYYLGTAYQKLEKPREAEAVFLQALRLSPSNTDIMNSLVQIYETAGDEEKKEKYRAKIKIVERNREEERAQARGDVS